MEGLLSQPVLEQLQLAPLQWGEYRTSPLRASACSLRVPRSPRGQRSPRGRVVCPGLRAGGAGNGVQLPPASVPCTRMDGFGSFSRARRVSHARAQPGAGREGLRDLTVGTTCLDVRFPCTWGRTSTPVCAVLKSNRKCFAEKQAKCRTFVEASGFIFYHVICFQSSRNNRLPTRLHLLSLPRKPWQGGVWSVLPPGEE